MVGALPSPLSLPLRFGLGAGLYFEYFRRPHASPSHFAIGFNRNLDMQLAQRAERYKNGEARQVAREAIEENALLFNLDRAPTTALMGMEMFAEQLAEYETIPDWQSCISDFHREIAETGSCYRRVYLEFLQEVQAILETGRLCAELTEIANEWDALAAELKYTLDDASRLERASRLLRRLAFREEHFWGNVLDL